MAELRDWRHHNGFSQYEAVRVLPDAGVPMTTNSLQTWEIGRSQPAGAMSTTYQGWYFGDLIGHDFDSVPNRHRQEPMPRSGRRPWRRCFIAPDPRCGPGLLAMPDGSIRRPSGKRRKAKNERSFNAGLRGPGRLRRGCLLRRPIPPKEGRPAPWPNPCNPTRRWPPWLERTVPQRWVAAQWAIRQGVRGCLRAIVMMPSQETRAAAVPPSDSRYPFSLPPSNACVLVER
jgi:hypothetical protein